MKKLATKLTWWQADILAVAICGLLTAAGYMLVLRPLADQQLQLHALRGQLTEAEGLAGEADHRRTLMSDELAEAQRELSTIPVQLEPVEQLNRRLAKIVQHAVDAGLTIHETRSADVETGLRYSTVPMTLSGTGTFPDCAEFLHRLFEQVPDVEVLGVDLSGQPGHRGVAVGFRFDLAWYAAASVAVAHEDQ